MTAIITATSLISSVSAQSFDIKKNAVSIKTKQEKCLEDYEELLLSFGSGKTIDYPDEYGGIYFDSKTGVTTICLTDINASKEYKQIFDKSTIEFKKVDYSLDEINETYWFISENMVKKNVTTVAVSEKTNDLIVSVESDKDKVILTEYLHTNGYNPDMVRFIENSSPIVLDVSTNISEETFSSNSSSINYAYTGNSLCGRYGSNTYCNSLGTIGANAYDPVSNQYGIITAGHVANISNLSSFCNSSNIIMNNNVNVTSIFSGVCDVAFIPFNSSNPYVATTTLKNNNTTTCVYDTQPIVSPYMVGIEIVKYGATTGKQVGTITNLSASVQYANNVVISDMIQYDMERAGGDSGAPIGIEYSNGGGLYFMGIHSGGSGTTCYATKFRNIEEQLGVIILSAI